MRRPLTVAIAALTLASAITSPALADRDRHHHRRDRHHDKDDDVAAAAVVAGVVGLVIGAAVAGSKRQARYEAPRTALPPPEYPRVDAEGWHGPYADGTSEGCFMQRWVYDREADVTVPERRDVDCREAAL